MKRKLTINFTRAIQKVSADPEVIEVVLLALRSEVSARDDSTYLPNPERRKVRLIEEKTIVTFDVEPSYSHGLDCPIIYRLGWRRGYLGKLEVKDFTMPDKDVNFEDLDENLVSDTFYLREADIGVRVAEIRNGRVVDPDGSPLALQSSVTQSIQREADIRAGEDGRIVAYVDEKIGKVDSNAETIARGLIAESERRTGVKISSLEETDQVLDRRILELEKGNLGDIEDLLENKADLVAGRIPLNQIPEEAYNNLHQISDNSRLSTLTSASRRDLAVSPTDTWYLDGDDVSVSTNWVKIAALKSGIQSVNGKTGPSVNLSASDVGARPAGSIPVNDVNGLSGFVDGRLVGVVRVNEQDRIDTSLLESDVPRLDGTRIVNEAGEEIAVAGDVTSVNGEKGDVTVTPASIGARPAGDITIADVKDLKTSLDKKVEGTDSRLSDSRTPKSHADTHDVNGSDPVSIAQSQVRDLVRDLADKPTQKAFDDFRDQVLSGLPDDPEQYETAAKEFAAVSLEAAGVSTDKSEKAAQYLSQMGDAYVDVEEKISPFNEKYEDVKSWKEDFDGKYDQVESWVASIGGQSEEVARLSGEVSSAHDEVVSSLEEVRQAALDADSISSQAADVQTKSALVSGLASDFQSRAQKIDDHTDVLEIQVEENTSTVNGFRDALNGKSPKEHFHTSADISDATDAPNADTLAKRDGSGRIGVGVPSANEHATTKKYVDEQDVILRDTIEAVSGRVSDWDPEDTTSSAGKLVPRTETGQVKLPLLPDNEDEAVSQKYTLDTFLKQSDPVVGATENSIPKRSASGEVLTGTPSDDSASVPLKFMKEFVAESISNMDFDDSLYARKTDLAPINQSISDLVSNGESLQTEINKKVDITSEVRKLYGTNSEGEQITYPAAFDAVPGVAIRSGEGVLPVGAPVDDDHATTKGYVDGKLSGKANSSHTHEMSAVTGLQASLDSKASQSSVDSLSDTVGSVQSGLGGKLDSDKIQFVTSKPGTPEDGVLYIVVGG